MALTARRYDAVGINMMAINTSVAKLAPFGMSAMIKLDRAVNICELVNGHSIRTVANRILAGKISSEPRAGFQKIWLIICRKLFLDMTSPAIAVQGASIQLRTAMNRSFPMPAGKGRSDSECRQGRQHQ